MSGAQNSDGTARRVVGRPFPKGVSGNPAGRPRGLSRTTRELVGDDGMPLIELWWSIARDPMQRTSDRLVASRLLADRGWGKPATFEPLEGDPFDLADVERAAEEFRANILRLAEAGEQTDSEDPGQRQRDRRARSTAIAVTTPA
jgi:hypothetical protein